MRNFKPLDNQADIGQCSYSRTINGRLTPTRWKVLTQYCNSQTYRERCHCEHDCCGHKYEQSIFINNSELHANGTRDIVLTLHEFFNV